MEYKDVNIRISWPDPQVRRMFDKRGFSFETPYDVLVLGGGEDVIPFLYGEKPLATTHCNYNRDLEEIKAVRHFPSNKPKVGICRGGQLLNVLSGGRMYQHVDNHACGRHNMLDIATNKSVYVTSTHHQMMRPSAQARIIAKAGLSTVKKSDNHEVPFKPKQDDPNTWSDVEVCYYEHSKSLCFQPHPEYGVVECEDYFFKLWDQYVMPAIKQSRDFAAARAI